MSSSIQRALEEIRTLSLGTLKGQWSRLAGKITGVVGCDGLNLIDSTVGLSEKVAKYQFELWRCVGKFCW